jgi:hypothetical protein
LGGGGDKNPPQGKIENPHKLQVKRKRKNSQREEVEQPISENDISLEDMDLEVDIENIHFPDEEQRLQESQQVAVELATQEEDFSEEESFSIQNALFDKNSRKLIFEGFDPKIKRENLILSMISTNYFHLELLRYTR